VVGAIVESVIEAVIQARKLSTNLELLYVSPSPITEAMRNKINSMTADVDGIHIVEGPIPPEEMAEALCCGDIWASFMSHDGIPNSMLEAMSCGLVPVVGDNPQLREWVQDGYTGFVVPLKDVRAMAARIVNLAENRTLRAELSSRCMKKICEEGSYENNMERMMKFVLQARSSKDITE